MSNLEGHVKKIQQLADLADEIDAKLDDLHGLDRWVGLSFSDTKTFDRLFEINVWEEKLQKYLESLPQEDLRQVHALMYSGRDGHLLQEMLDYFDDSEIDAEECIEAILDKRMALKVFLTKGLASRAEAEIN